MIIKSPACYDISHWKTVPDFAAISPRPLLIITKATEGNNYIDPTFVSYFHKMLLAGYKRGCYHFFRRSIDARQQAIHFTNVIASYVDDSDILVLDFEEGSETAAQLLIFLEYVQQVYPRNIIMNYSRAALMNAIAMTEAQKTRMKGYPTWTAGYPINADLYDVPPSIYTPDKTRWGPVWLWQYTSHGQVAGIDGDTDCNWMHPTLEKIISIGQPETGELMKYKVVWSRGVTKRTGPTTSAVSVKDSAGQAVVIPLDAVVDVIADGIADTTYPNDVNRQWARFPDGSYGATNYPNEYGIPQVRMMAVAEPPPPAEVYLTHTIEVFSNGDIKVDGISFE